MGKHPICRTEMFPLSLGILCKQIHNPRASPRPKNYKLPPGLFFGSMILIKMAMDSTYVHVICSKSCSKRLVSFSQPTEKNLESYKSPGWKGPQKSLRNRTKYAGTRDPSSGLALQLVECHWGLTQEGSGEYQTQAQLQVCFFPGHEVTTGEAQTQLLFVKGPHQDDNWFQNMTPPLSKRL